MFENAVSRKPILWYFQNDKFSTKSNEERASERASESERERETINEHKKNWGAHKTLNELAHLADLCITTEKKIIYNATAFHFQPIRNIIFVAMAMFAIWFLFDFWCVCVDFIFSTNLFYYVGLFLFGFDVEKSTEFTFISKWDELKSAKCLCNTH